ncbi:MAG: SpoIIE family protein phosphatase [Bacteroidia bacterium]|nr:SpoIIE family protein phosphatase [Bacteroidia bacterium]
MTNDLLEIKGDKMPVAIHENMKPFTNHVIQLQTGDIIYLASDGYEDQFGGPKGKKFLSKKLKQLLTENCNKPMAEQKEILDKTIEDWKNNYREKYEQTDDITIMGIKIS